jgi:hypothetical protein
MGKSSILEGGVGLFLLGGSALAIALVIWAKGVALRKALPYNAVFEFPLASGISVGTPVRIRGVQVGRPAAGAREGERPSHALALRVTWPAWVAGGRRVSAAAFMVPGRAAKCVNAPACARAHADAHAAPLREL